MECSRKTRLTLAALLVASALAGCGGGNQPPPSGDGLVLKGNERFGWDQPAGDRSELASFRYAMYVDGARTEAADVTCASTRTAAGFACTCQMPQMSPGTHTLQIAAYVLDGTTLKESSRSAAVRVTVR